MTKKELMVFWNGEEWIKYDSDSVGEFEEIVNFNEIDSLANSLHWSLSHKTISQRKWRQSGCMTKSIYAMLDTVKSKLAEGEKVFCQTPDIIVHFRSI